MKYPIQIIGTEILRQSGNEVALEKTPEMDKLISDMFETMKTSDGVGLAAQQIGKNLQLFLVDLSNLDEEEHPELKNFKKVFINTKIIEVSEKTVKMNEGCLSIPGLREDVVRPESIKLQYYDENMKPHQETFDSFPARVILHEFDHTKGILFTDRIPKVKKVLLKNKLKALANGKFSADYKTELGNKKTREQFLQKNI